jgi:hypothetical protein
VIGPIELRLSAYIVEVARDDAVSDTPVRVQYSIHVGAARFERALRLADDDSLRIEVAVMRAVFAEIKELLGRP